MSCSTNGSVTLVPKEWACPAPHDIRHITVQTVDVTDVISGSGHAYCFETVMCGCPLVETGHAHCFGTVMWRMSISGAGHAHCFRTVMWRMSISGAGHAHCSETVSIRSTNGIRHITVPKEWACPAPLMASVTLLFWNSSMSYSTNGISHIIVPKQWACPVPLVDQDMLTVSEQ